MQRHVLGAVFAHVGLGGLEGDVAGVGFGAAGQVDHQLGQGEVAFGAAHAFVGVPGFDGHLQGARVGQADVFDGHAGHAAGQVDRVAAAVEHAREPVKRGVGVGAAHGFVQGRDLVVELFPLFVEAAGAVGQHLHQGGLGDVAAFVGGQFGGDFQQGQAAAHVAVGGAGDLLQALVVDGDALPAQAALFVGQGALEGFDDVVARHRFQHMHAAAREQRGVEFE